MYHVIEQKVKCSKCKSLNIAKPANENATWVYKCLDCGHTKDYKPPTITKATDGIGYTSSLNDLIEF